MAELKIKPVELDEELRLANELMAKSHKLNYFSAIRWLENNGATYPGHRPEHTRIVLCDDEVAGALRVNAETIRLGEARLKMAGVGWVTTSPRYRHRGICSALMRDTTKYLQRRGYHVAMLFGIPNFYHRFGYVTTLADYAICVDTVEASAARRTEHSVRPVKPGDIRAIQKIHDANDSGIPCSILRSAAHFTNRWDRFKAARAFTDRKGKVVAYILPMGSEGRLNIEEVGVATQSACHEVLSYCAEWAQREFTGRIRFQIPPNHPFAKYLLHFDSVHEMSVVRDSGGMMAFVDLAETLENMIPEWEDLLVQSRLGGVRCEFTLLVDRVPYRIRANRGAIDVAQCTGENKISLTHGEFAQLLTGYRFPDEILDAQRRILTQDARVLVQALFPKRQPFIWNFDRF